MKETNDWIVYVRSVRSPGMSWTDALKLASKTWVKGSGTKKRSKRARVLDFMKDDKGKLPSRSGALHSMGNKHANACVPLKERDCGKHPQCNWNKPKKSCWKKTGNYKPSSSLKTLGVARVQRGGNPWMTHLDATRRANPRMTLKQAMKAASSTYRR